MDMNLSIRPHAIALMVKDNSHIYQLLRVVPSLLEQVGPKKICTSWLNIVYDSNQGWELVVVVVNSANDYIRWHINE